MIGVTDIERGLSLVRSVSCSVSRRIPCHVELSDLESAGLTGLATALRNYDPQRGVPFAPYASQRIRWAIQDQLRECDGLSRGDRHDAAELQTGAVGAWCSLDEAPVTTAKETPMHSAVRGDLWGFVSKLPPRLSAVLLALYVRGKTMREVADDIGVTESRISQIHSEAVEKLRRRLKAKQVDRMDLELTTCT